MKNFLLVCQSQDGSFVNLIRSALNENEHSLTAFTGKNDGIESRTTVVNAPKYNSTTFGSRFKTWFSFVHAAKKYLKNNIDKFDAIIFTSNPPVNQSLVKYAQKKKNQSILYIQSNFLYLNWISDISYHLFPYKKVNFWLLLYRNFLLKSRII